MIKNLLQFAQHPPSRTIAFAFFAMSILFGSWIARIPEIQEKLDLSEGMLGLCLLGVPFGALLMTLSSNYIARFLYGGLATYFSIIGLALCIPLIAFANSIAWLLPVFILVGWFNCFLDIAMNDSANAIEQEYGVRILSTCHGVFSLGAMIGAALSGLFSTWGWAFHWHLLGVSAIILVSNFYLRQALIRLPNVRHEASPWSWPPSALWSLAIIGFCIMLGEGAIADWSAIYLKNNLQSNAFIAGLGFAGFSLTMTIGRFSGDQWRERFSDQKIIRVGSLLGALGLTIAAVFPHPTIVILGFMLVGLGFSCVVPLLFSAATQIPEVDPGKGITAITGSGIIGFLCGPPLMGFVAEGFGLAVSFGLVGLLAFLCFLLTYTTSS